MSAGLMRHDTELRVEKHCGDSQGQAEGAFACGHLWGGVRLMPRLKRSTYARLDFPATGRSNPFPHRAGVLGRPRRWDLMAPPPAELVKPAVALTRGTATPDAMLKRVHSDTVPPPTASALAARGKGRKPLTAVSIYPRWPSVLRLTRA
jgi:TnpA family transposase